MACQVKHGRQRSDADAPMCLDDVYVMTTHSAADAATTVAALMQPAQIWDAQESTSDNIWTYLLHTYRTNADWMLCAEILTFTEHSF